MEINAMQIPSAASASNAADRAREIAEQEQIEQKRIRQMELEQQAQVEMHARSPEQSAGRVIDQIV